MANLITEVYVSVDGLEFTKLDLHKDESINMKYTQKDLQDISKIFAPYSQNFTFPATPKNRRAFGFFGDTTVVKINTEKKYFCKIYSSGQLFQNGYLMISDLSYKNNRPVDFTGSFANNITNLRDRIGEDTLNDLGSYQLEWNPNKAYQLIQGTESFTIDGINYLYYVPLISNSRVWSYDVDPTSTKFDNIAFRDGTNPLGNNVVKTTELRPALAFKTIFNLIKKKYGLDIVMPLENREEFTKAFFWCNSESILSSVYNKIVLKSAFNSAFAVKTFGGLNINTISIPYKYTSTINLTDSSFKIINNNPSSNLYSKYFDLFLKFENLYIYSDTETSSSVDVSLVKKGVTDAFITKTFDFSNGTPIFSIQVSDIYFDANEIEFYVYVKFNEPVNWTNFGTGINFYFKKLPPPYTPSPVTQSLFATIKQESNINQNALDSGAGKIDLIQTLPNTKVIDFLNSFIKSFNISIYDTSPNDNKLYFLTPSDVETTGLVYSKATLDYTPYVDISSHKKSVPNEYNYYNFKHVTSKYRSNMDFKTQTGVEYGQTIYPSTKPSNPKEFKVETNFSIIPPRLVDGSENIITAYGFNADTPTILDSGESRYKPNFNELTFFYLNVINFGLMNEVGFQGNPTGFAFVYQKLDRYMASLPYLLSNGNSFAFSKLKEQNIEYPINLFSEYYQANIIRYLDTNVLSQEFKLTLPASELYLNEATTIQGGGATPVGFRLQNDIIIGETKFSILDAQIDITTGKTKLTLLNY
jgi:hypothetical protein